MVNDMDESFLITPSWDKVCKRIKASQEEGGPSTMLRINSRDGGKERGSTLCTDVP